jgi:hypothetical protein
VLNTSIWIAIGVLHLIAIADVWTSRLTTTGRVLWTLILIFMPVVGFFCWLLTRSSAHSNLEEIPPDAYVGPINE